GADLALALELGKGFVDLAPVKDRQVVAVGMHQHQVDDVGFQPAQAALHRKARVRRREVEARGSVLELLADLADDHPVLPGAAQQRAEALLADAVGRRGVDQVDAQLTGLGEQGAGGRVIRDREAVGILHALVATELDGAEAQRRDQQAGVAERAMQVVQPAHGSFQGAWATGGRGRAAGSWLAWPGWMPACSRCWKTRSARSGDSASLVGQPTS